MVKDGHTVRSVDGVRWVSIDEGVVRVGEGVAGRLGESDNICLTEHDWLIAEGPARLSVRSSQDMLAEGLLWQAALTHATRFLYIIDRRVERRARTEHVALTERDGSESRAVASAAQSFAAVLADTQSSRVRLSEVVTDSPALAAMRLVASSLGVTVRSPVSGEGHGRRVDPLQRIALASGLRTRGVRLEASWWKQDLGPMIGYQKADDQPVALLPDRRRYVVALPGQTQVTPITRRVAGLLADRALVLYPPLPPGTRGARALLRFGRRYSRGDIWVIGLVGALVALVGLATPVLTGLVLGTFVQRAERSLIVDGSLLVIGSAFVVAVLSAVQNIAALRLEGRASATLQAAVWARLLSLPASFFSHYSTGELGTAALGVNAAQESLSSVTTVATLGALTGSANLVLLYFYDIWLALLATGLVAAGAGVCLVAGIYEVRFQRSLYAVEQTLSSKVFQLLCGLPKLRVAAAEDRAFTVWSEIFARGRSLAASGRRIQNVVTTFNAGFPLLCSIVIFALVAGPVRAHLSITAFLSFYAAFSLLLGSALQFTGIAITAMGVVPMIEKLAPILDATPEANADKTDPGELAGSVELAGVSFRYGDGPLVLDGITFSVLPGEFVAIVGPTGCGKSTILRLLLGFEEPTTGAVLYDGQDLGDLEVTAVRRQCGVVLQNGSLLAGDIRTNIVGSSTYTMDDAWAAATMASVDEDIAAMPMGMQTVLSEGTNTLSGGQRQRIMIARALVSRPRIVFFDEATSALDNPAQKIVAESTHRLNATRIVIAHRLSTVRDADRIIVLDRGRIVQQGSYDDLLADDSGLFTRLALPQIA